MFSIQKIYILLCCRHKQEKKTWAPKCYYFQCCWILFFCVQSNLYNITPTFGANALRRCSNWNVYLTNYPKSIWNTFRDRLRKRISILITSYCRCYLQLHSKLANGRPIEILFLINSFVNWYDWEKLKCGYHLEYQIGAGVWIVDE